MKKTINKLLAEYGVIAVILYFTIFFAVLGAAYLAIRAGWAPEGTAGKAGAWTAAYIVTKLTQPFRIAATVLLTPVLAKVWERVTGRPRASADDQRIPPA